MSKIPKLKDRSNSFRKAAQHCPLLFQDEYLDYCSATDDGVGDYKPCEASSCSFLYWLQMFYNRKINWSELS